MQRIVLVNAKGGCGKTTLATSIAAWYAAAGRATCLLDMDPQGSSSQWLHARPAECAKISGVWTHKRMGGMTRSFALRIPQNTECLVVDTPAGLTRGEMGEILYNADAVIVPVLPSAFDIRAASRTIADLLLATKKLRREHRLSVVANRVRQNTQIYDSLTRFLDSLTIPFIASLRNTNHYVTAADKGLGIHEIDSSRAKTDKLQWRTIIRWIDTGSTERPSASDPAAHPYE